MALDLRSVDAKLNRAKEHLDAVYAAVADRLNTGNYHVTKHANSDFTQHYWVFHAPHGTNYDDISLMVGDCVHNLRSALDHFVYSIAIHESGENPPPDANKLAFPLACNRPQWNDAKNRVRTLSQGVRTAIEGIQPYNRPHPELPPLLGLLGEFDDVDKHRLLQVAAGAFSKASYGFGLAPGEPSPQVAINVKPLEDGAVVAALIFDRPHPDMQGGFDGDFMLVLPHAPGPQIKRGTEVRVLLTTLFDEVRAIIDKVKAIVI